MTRRTALVAAAATAAVLAGCADDGVPQPAAERPSSAVIATTLVPVTATAAPATAPPTTAASTTTAATTSTTSTAGTTETTVPATTSTSTTSTTATTTTLPPRVGNPVVAAEPIGSFSQPVDLVPRPGVPGFYVVEQGGRIVHWDAGATTVVLQLDGEQLSTGGEQGLLGLAFSPDGGTAYIDHTAPDDATTIAEYRIGTDGLFDPASARELIVIDQPYRNHNAGDLYTDADGLLYITLGDGGSANDPERRASDPTSWLGSLLRIDPTPDGERPYSIPPDNPFAAGPFEGIEGAPEVFAWGLRNPWKVAVDPVTGELWIADVGQNEVEEINVVGPTAEHAAGWGHDFGWSAFEGDRRFNDDVPDSGRTTPPVLTYRHGADGCSVSGGVPYRGTAITELEPAYLYSDYCSGILWALDLAGRRNLVLRDGFSGVTAVRADAAGEVYVLEAGGTIHRLVPG